MVEIINTWAQRIIIVIIICTIIEMLLPEGKNKKYIKIVIGIYVVFTIVSPIISKINSNSLNLSEHLTIDEPQTIEISTSLNTNEYIENVYKEKLKEDIKIKVEELDYNVQNIELEIETKDEENYGTILELSLKVSAKNQKEIQNNIKIEKIVIGEEKMEESYILDKEKEEIKLYLSEIYCINEEKIYIY